MVKTLEECMSVGGVTKVLGTLVIFDYPSCTDIDTVLSGYYIVNALGHKVYFKCKDRKKSQLVCDSIFGKGHYVVRSCM